MHYAIVSETYPPEINGVALTVQGLEQGLRTRGHEITVVRPRQAGESNPAPHETLMPSVPLPRYPGLRVGLPATGKLTRIWRASTPDAIYVATEGPLGWSALRAARGLQIPAATGFHTRFDEYVRDYGAALLQKPALGWMRRFHNRADATVVPTYELQHFLCELGFRNVWRLPRAVDTELFDPRRRDPDLRKEWGIAQNATAVIYVGRIAVEKNLTLAVNAFRALQRVCPDARFVWVGDGPERKRLAQANPDFLFCGIQRNAGLARHFASADLFLFPSRSETFGNVTLEALASGVPTIAFDYGAAREYLRNGVHGAALADGDDAGFIAACVKIGSNASLRKPMRVATRQAVTALRPAQVAADFDDILQQLIRDRGQDAYVAVA